MKISKDDIDVTLMVLVYDRAAHDEILPRTSREAAATFADKLQERITEVLPATVMTEIADLLELLLQQDFRYSLAEREKMRSPRITPPKETPNE